MSAEHSSHTQAQGHDDHAPHTGIYKKIGAVLLVFTFVTVVISWLPIKAVALVVALGLAVATFKASLVAAIFMHLAGEKKIIWWTLTLCAVFFAALIFLPVFTSSDNAGKSIAPPVPHMHAEAHGDAHAAPAADAPHAEGAAPEAH